MADLGKHLHSKVAQECRTPRRFSLSNAHPSSRQSHGVRRFCAAFAIHAVLAGVLFGAALPGFAAEELRGAVVCLSEKNEQPRAIHDHILGFKTTDARVYKLTKTRFSEALFFDKRLHERELLLKGNLSEDNKSFDALTIRSIKNGVVHDLYYYCEICAIESVSPDICGCCRLPVELVEKPLK